MKKYNYIVAGTAIVIGIAVLYLAKDFPRHFYGTPGEGVWPGAIAWLLIVLGLFTAFAELFGKGSVDAVAGVDFASPQVKMVYFFAGVTFAYGAVILLLGFLAATLIYLPITMLLLREESRFFIALVTVATVAVCFLLFNVVLGSPLATSVVFR